MFDVIVLAPLRQHKRVALLLLGLGMAGCVEGPAAGGGAPPPPAPPSARAAGTPRSPSGSSRLGPSESWNIKSKVRKGKDLSGIALFAASHGVLVSDEVTACQIFELDRAERCLRMTATVPLAETQDDAELDLEGVAADGQWCYFMGSHGLAKKSGERAPDRMGLFRIPVARLQQAAGGELPSGQGSGVERSSLAGLLQRDPVLGPHFGQPLQHRGLNLEGLAIRDGRLFLGVRNPNLAGEALVVELPADAPFRPGVAPDYTLHRLKVGPGLGIRELTWAGDRFLLLVGNAGSEPSDTIPQAVDYREDEPFYLLAWDGQGSAVVTLGQLHDPPGKAEAMMVLDQTDRYWDLLLLFDGVKEGAPAAYRVPKP